MILASSCGPAPTPPSATPAEPTQDDAPIPNSLDVYEELGYLVGTPDFPAVGNFAHLPGPGDSAYVILALSLANRAFRFRPAASGFLGRYRVRAVVGDTLAPIASLDEEEEVRVRSFRETSRRDESIVFQGVMKLPAGEYRAVVQVRDLNSTRGFETSLDLTVPRFDPPFVTAPIAVYEVDRREDRDSAPTLLLNPRATVELSGRPRFYVESQPAADVVLTAYEGNQRVLADTFPAADTGGGARAEGEGRLHASVLVVEAGRLPPGGLTLLAQTPGVANSDSTRLVVALTSDWVVTDYPDALSYLRYAGTPSELDDLRRAAPGEQAQVLHRFWRQRDPEPETAENEFFERYFDRIREANERFGVVGDPGWLTDRGAAYVTFGPPDEVLRYLDVQAGPDNNQVWLYDESLGFELRLVFEDASGSGAYRLTAESRRALLEAVETLYTETARR